MEKTSTAARRRGIDLLVADDDEGMRILLSTVLRATDGIASVVEAVDGAEAVELGRAGELDVAVLDLNMPRMDGIEAASRLRERQPRLRIALNSADWTLLRRRGAGLDLPLFDKLDLGRLLEWVEQQAGMASAACAPPLFASAGAAPARSRRRGLA